MRSLAEIDADIAEVQKRIAARDAGTPQRNSPEYRAARFDYIVDGDRSGLDAYQNALNAAIQNKLSRDAQEKLVKLGRQQTDDENMEQWQKDYTFAKSAREEINANPKSTPKQKEDAEATVRYYEAIGAKKGYMKKYAEMTKAPEAPKAETPAAAPAQPAGESFKQLIAKGQTLETDEDLDNHIKALLAYKGNDAVVQEAYDAIKAAQDKKQKNLNDRFEKWKSDTDTYLGEKDYGKRSKLLQGQRDSSEEFKDLKDYEKYNQKIEKGMKKPVASPVVQYIKNLKADNLMSVYTELRKAKTPTKMDNAAIGEKSYPYKVTYNRNDKSLTVSGGGYSRTFKASDFSEESLGNEKKPESTNTIASILSGGDSGKKVNRGSASRKARVAEPED